ncbi:hypothetical protein LTR91_000772 [Friedmanniomyces endolithicus]|uniref:Uncharacterized protein n=2 Tax=Dothideomycetidae TaxID=451867 RepID=A0AAN6L0T7_9PEZI|nr:hypothetical protein LTR59_006739 [Friedmanniomyces endolithicus]KAK0817119.1 hypothetical protein LTR38_001755 [Friedmanniomyces endolithicus]KAK0852840.1 hypothetical protein LTR03_003274 [Friedmanniomyces endolithicus]KAK0864416.1 hypothetical protein LTS02_005952 [Friedmanniomyces endolithicus]KAK0885335.1 hypothetical protein LTR87_000969 [Friedmanniomyces endolithicus]
MSSPPIIAKVKSSPPSVKMSAHHLFASHAGPNSTRRPSQPTNQITNARPGLIAFLPNTAVIDRQSQPWVSARTGNHPVCILGLLDNGRTACCAQLTSFGDSTLETKYQSPSALAVMQQIYLPIQHAKSTYPRAPSVLRLDNNQQMVKQTYVNTAAWFMIKTTELTSMRSINGGLDQTSIDKLHHALEKLVKGQTSMPVRTPSSPLMPLHCRKWTLTDLGISPASPPDLMPVQKAQIHQQLAKKKMNAAAKPFSPRVSLGPVPTTPLASISHNVTRCAPLQKRSNGIVKTPSSWARVAALA